MFVASTPTHLTPVPCRCLVVGSTIAFNTAGDGAGIMAASNASVSAVNTTFDSNTALDGGGGLSAQNGAQVHLNAWQAAAAHLKCAVLEF